MTFWMFINNFRVTQRCGAFQRSWNEIKVIQVFSILPGLTFCYAYLDILVASIRMTRTTNYLFQTLKITGSSSIWESAYLAGKWSSLVLRFYKQGSNIWRRKLKRSSISCTLRPPNRFLESTGMFNFYRRFLHRRCPTSTSTWGYEGYSNTAVDSWSKHKDWGLQTEFKSDSLTDSPNTWFSTSSETHVAVPLMLFSSNSSKVNGILLVSSPTSLTTLKGSTALTTRSLQQSMWPSNTSSIWLVDMFSFTPITKPSPSPSGKDRTNNSLHDSSRS